MKNHFKLVWLLQVLLVSLVLTAKAQQENLDKVIAIVGDKIILRSDIEQSFEEYKRENPNAAESMKCEFLENALSQKIVTEQADRDSVFVTDDEVEAILKTVYAIMSTNMDLKKSFKKSQAAQFIN